MQGARARIASRRLPWVRRARSETRHPLAASVRLPFHLGKNTPRGRAHRRASGPSDNDDGGQAPAAEACYIRIRSALGSYIGARLAVAATRRPAISIS